MREFIENQKHRRYIFNSPNPIHCGIIKRSNEERPKVAPKSMSIGFGGLFYIIIIIINLVDDERDCVCRNC